MYILFILFSIEENMMRVKFICLFGWTCGVSSLGFETALVCHLCDLTQSNEAWALRTSKATHAAICKSSTCNQLRSLSSKRVNQTLMQTVRRKDILPCRFIRLTFLHISTQNSKTKTFWCGKTFLCGVQRFLFSISIHYKSINSTFCSKFNWKIWCG